MRYAETLLAEFDTEMKTTRTMLEQVPYGTDATKPGNKSRTMHELAAHIANIVRFGDLAIGANERDFSAPGATMPATYDSTAELLKTFDANVAASRAAIQGLDESTLGDTFTLRRGEKVVRHGQSSTARNFCRLLASNRTASWAHSITGSPCSDQSRK